MPASGKFGIGIFSTPVAVLRHPKQLATVSGAGRQKRDIVREAEDRDHTLVDFAPSKAVTSEQMEISRLRAELARVKMERDAWK